MEGLAVGLCAAPVGVTVGVVFTVGVTVGVVFTVGVTVGVVVGACVGDGDGEATVSAVSGLRDRGGGNPARRGHPDRLRDGRSGRAGGAARLGRC